MKIYINSSKILHIVISEPKFLIEKDSIWTEFDRNNPLIDFLEINCGNYDYDYNKIILPPTFSKNIRFFEIEDIRIKCFKPLDKAINNKIFFRNLMLEYFI